MKKILALTASIAVLGMFAVAPASASDYAIAAMVGKQTTTITDQTAKANGAAATINDWAAVTVSALNAGNVASGTFSSQAGSNYQNVGDVVAGAGAVFIQKADITSQYADASGNANTQLSHAQADVSALNAGNVLTVVGTSTANLPH